MSFGQQPFGSEQPPSWMTNTPQWQASSSAGEGANDAPGNGAPQARMLLVVLATVVTELVLIGGAANQWISKKIADDAAGDFSFWHLFEQSWLTFQWRASPRSGQSTQWGSQLALVGVTVVVSALLVWVLVRGAVTFWRAFFATWLAVLAAALVGAFVRGLIDTSDLRSIGSAVGPGRVTKAVYGPLGPSQLAVVGGFVLGLVTALIVGAVAVLTRRGTAAPPAAAAAEAAPYAVPEQPPPYYGEHPSGAPAAPAAAPWQDQHFEPRGRHSVGQPPGTASSEQPTTAYQPVAGDEPTQFYQPPPPPTYQGGGYRPAGEPTTQFPRPPDDEGTHQ